MATKIRRTELFLDEVKRGLLSVDQVFNRHRAQIQIEDHQPSMLKHVPGKLIWRVLGKIDDSRGRWRRRRSLAGGHLQLPERSSKSKVVIFWGTLSSIDGEIVSGEVLDWISLLVRHNHVHNHQILIDTQRVNAALLSW